MEKIEIEANKREVLGKKVKHLKRMGIIPAVVYGRNMDPVAVSVDNKAILKILKNLANRNEIVNLNLKSIGSNTILPVIIHQMQKHALKNTIEHIDFYRVVMDELMKTSVKVVLKGESIGVKEDGGIMVHSTSSVDVRCLPGDIPENFVIDVSPLKIGDTVHVSDLVVSKKVEILASLEDILVTIVPPAREEVEAPAAVAAETAATTATSEGAAPAGTAEAKAEPKEKAKEEKK